MKSILEEDKHTPGAMRAAEQVVLCINNALDSMGMATVPDRPVINKTAGLIDRATGLPELLAYVNKTADWLERRIKHAEETAATSGFSTLTDACHTDAANYKVQLKEARAALAKHEGRGHE